MSSERKADRTGPAAPSRSRGRGSPEYLRGAAILEIGDVRTLDNSPLPREIAVAFPDDRQPLTWLVAVEADWPRPGGEASANYRHASDVIGPGRGMPPALVAHELAEAVSGCTVYASDWQLAQNWAAALFSTIGRAQPPFEIHNLDRLVESQDALPAECMRASHVADGWVRRLTRAATEAAWYAGFVLAVRRQVQSRTGRWPPASRATEPRRRAPGSSRPHKPERES